MVTEQQKKSSEVWDVLYWEYVFNVGFKQVEELLDSKHKYLKSLKYELYHEMNEDEDLIAQIRILEEEMSKMITLIASTEQLKMAYMGSTADNASLLIDLSTENYSLKEEKMELEVELGYYRILSDILVERLRLCGKGGYHE